MKYILEPRLCMKGHNRAVGMNKRNHLELLEYIDHRFDMSNRCQGS